MIDNNIIFITSFTSAVINLQCCYQIVISIDHPFECTINDHVNSNIHGFIINKRQPYHAFAAKETRVLVGYFEEETTLGNAIKSKLDGKVILSLNKEVSKNLINNFLPNLDDSIQTLKQNAVLFFDSLLLSDTPNSKLRTEFIDPRIATIIKYISENIKRKITLKKMAAEVYLSVDRTRHLFLEETGTTLRQYILWKRVQQTVYKVLNENWTPSEACILCGFNDISHFSRVFKNMFGIAPKHPLNSIIFLSMPDIYGAKD
ncbi:MAG: helix-turn-helix transcriptional regulator [Saprospiraceae bacterium]|nr:AraC family transcriptional regulator [Candidatus Brachybacter algidus]MBK8750118.1 helix-turn-helix transcriptional regulator [Candidatus Brachybacter algidus]